MHHTTAHPIRQQPTITPLTHVVSTFCQPVPRSRSRQRQEQQVDEVEPLLSRVRLEGLSCRTVSERLGFLDG